MKGRTRSFFEDVFVLLIILGVFVTGYYLFFSEEEKKQQTIATSVTKVENEESAIIHKETLVEKEQEEIIEQNNYLEDQKEATLDPKKEDKEKQQVPLQEETTEKIDQKDTQGDEEISTTKVDPNRIAHLVKNVDLQLLKKFKEDIKQAMKDSIVLDETRDIEEQNFSIRVTVLKNGEYEQLTFRGGDQVTFEQNQANILKVFPLEIDPKIVQDFPRYLRYTFKFSKKEN